jgi:Uma2 family endonuclease
MHERHATLEKSAEVPDPRRYTYDELVAEFPESNQPCELWDGELIMSPSPSFFHQRVVARFFKQLDAWVSTRTVGQAVLGPIDMVLSAHLVVQPDVAFIATERLSIIKRAIHGPVDLAAEVVSLGNRNRDRIEKRDLYEQYGVKEYWIIDPEAETAEILFLENGRYQLVIRASAGQSAPSRLLPGFGCSVDSLFSDE